MNYRFRKLPVEIEAFQMTKERRQDNSLWPQWLHEAWNETRGALGGVWPIMSEVGIGIGGVESVAHLLNTYELGKDPLCIGTKEGRMVCDFDNWIIRGVKGELYCCDPEIFKLTYEAVE